MSSQILISVSPWDIRVALLEQGRLAELYVERRGHPDPTGNIYQGRVVRVLPGMDAAFVDIGMERPAYLNVKEVTGQWDTFFNFWLKDEPPDTLGNSFWADFPAPIEDLLQEGQEILVQVCRPPLGSKGARLTTHISLPGYYLVYAPTLSHLGVSRRIPDQVERERLLKLLEDLRPQEGGLIARTAALGQSAATLHRERDALVSLWQTVLRKRNSAHAPALLQPELDFPRRLVRELMGPDVDRVLIDDLPTYEAVLQYVASLNQRQSNRVEYHTEAEPLFTHFGVETDWLKLLAARVRLKSGGYLRLDATEALTAIDVNTGRFIGRHHLEDTILKTNLEAAQEVARQVRLRNIGGLVVIDFIDMKKASHREAVYRALLEAVKADRAKTFVTPISTLGLVEMSREQLREPLAHLVTEICRRCDGKGFRPDPLAVAHDILRQLAADLREFPGCRFTVTAHPEVTALTAAEGQPWWEPWAQKYRSEVKIIEQPHFAPEKFEIIREWR